MFNGTTTAVWYKGYPIGIKPDHFTVIGRSFDTLQQAKAHLDRYGISDHTVEVVHSIEGF